MRQSQHKNRSRSRSRRQSSPVNRVFESNGPDVKVRGTAQHVAEKYMQLGRDALSSGDNIKAEGYFQHAEHYLRILAAVQAQIQSRRQQPQPDAGAQPRERARGNGQDRPTTEAATSPTAEETRQSPDKTKPAPEEGDWGGPQPQFLKTSADAAGDETAEGGEKKRPRRARTVRRTRKEESSNDSNSSASDEQPATSDPVGDGPDAATSV